MKFICYLSIVFILLAFAEFTAAAPPPPPNYQISAPSWQLQNEEQVWFCPTDSNVLVANWRDFRYGYRQIGVGRSSDGGNFWLDSLVSPGLQVFDRQSDPTLTVNADGDFFMSYLDYSSVLTVLNDSSFITFIKSTDKGLSWTGPYTVEDTIGAYFEDKQFITVDRTGGPYNGNVYVAWARFPNPNRIMFARSTTGAVSFDDTVVIGPTITFNNQCGSGQIEGGQFANPFVGADGSVYVTWVGGDLDTVDCAYYYSLKLVKSVDGGVSWSSPKVIRHTFGNWSWVDGNIDVYNEPTVAADIFGGPFNGHLYMEYANMDTGNNQYDDFNIEFIRSTDGGVTWSEPIYVNDDYTGPGAMYDQFHPWLFINEEGILITIFYDQRTDPVNHYKFDVFAAYSFDGGLSFTANHRISDVSINPGFLAKAVDAGPTNPNPVRAPGQLLSPMAGKIAEYIGVTAFHDKITAVWTDTRNGNQDVFGANWYLPLLEPRLISPIAGDTTLNGVPTLRWATTWKNNDDRYRVELAGDPMLTTNLLTQYIDTNSLNIGLPLAEGTYFWRTKAFKISTGDSSDYSNVGHFFVDIYVCGDANGSGIVNIQDITYLINYLYKSGPKPKPLPAGDATGNGIINIQDITHLINYLYKGGPAPICP
ncbi:MAG: dockerin type I domain-containing protein [candidate division Zixibacteria bacterium]|nr:dockerin type I domain-containing protein [candidate division Zixibacteria bacterium]